MAWGNKLKSRLYAGKAGWGDSPMKSFLEGLEEFRKENPSVPGEEFKIITAAEIGQLEEQPREEQQTARAPKPPQPQ